MASSAADGMRIPLHSEQGFDCEEVAGQGKLSQRKNWAIFGAVMAAGMIGGVIGYAMVDSRAPALTYHQSHAKFMVPAVARAPLSPKAPAEAAPLGADTLNNGDAKYADLGTLQSEVQELQDLSKEVVRLQHQMEATENQSSLNFEPYHFALGALAGLASVIAATLLDIPGRLRSKVPVPVTGMNAELTPSFAAAAGLPSQHAQTMEENTQIVLQMFENTRQLVEPLKANMAMVACGPRRARDIRMMAEDDQEDDFDIYRDSPLRYMGYANEVGEAFAAFLPPIGVPASYGVAAVYVLADTFDKALAANEKEGAKEGVIVGLDTVSWQMLASVFWPGSFIRVMVNTTAFVESVVPVDLPVISGVDLEKALPTIVGLATIPFIVTPIDETIDWAMENSVTKLLRQKCKGLGDYGKSAGILAGCAVVPPTLFSVAGFIEGIGAAAI